MSAPAEPGRPARRHLGRGPGGAAPDAPHVVPTAPDADGSSAEGHGPRRPEAGRAPAEVPGPGTPATDGRVCGSRVPFVPTDPPAPAEVPRHGSSEPAGVVASGGGREAAAQDGPGHAVGSPGTAAGFGAPGFEGPDAGGAAPADPPGPVEVPRGTAAEGTPGDGHRPGSARSGRGAPAGAPRPAAPGQGPQDPSHGQGQGQGAGERRFTLRLANFEGPFDLLLQLISRHKLDVTEVALSQVTDEFMAYIRAMGPDWDLDQTSEFLVVAATLLDLKAARLLPAAEVEDEADLALLEARDLLFARLLQYRAYKQVAGLFEDWSRQEGRRYPRTVGLEPHHAELLPEVVISIGADGFARLAVQAMRPRAEPQVYVEHIHAPLVSVREQAGLVVALLKARGEATFQELTAGAPDTLTVVARFLALLELYREKAVVLDQEEALGALTVRWSGGDGDGMPRVTDEFDQIVEAKE